MVNNCLSQQIKRNNDINKNPKTVILKAITRNMKQLDTKLHVLLEKNKKKNKEVEYMTDTMTPLMVGGLRELIMKGRRENIVKLPSKIFLYVASMKQNHVSII